MTLFAIAALAAALAASPTPAEAAPAAPPPAADQAEPAIRPVAGTDANGVGGPVEPLDFDISSTLGEGRTAQDESRWTGAVDARLERRYAPRLPRYNQITIEF